MDIMYAVFDHHNDQYIALGLFGSHDDAECAVAENGWDAGEVYVAAAIDMGNGNYEPAPEACGYCGDSQDPNDICYPCYHALSAPEETVNNHTAMCHEYWDRGLNCQCIDDGVKQAIRAGANPEDVM